MRALTSTLIFGALAALLTAAGCQTEDALDERTPGPGELTIDRITDLRVQVQNDLGRPIANAAVAIDTVDGLRVEGTTTRSGIVTFEDLRFRDVESVVAAAEGTSFVALDGWFAERAMIDDAPLTIELIPLEPERELVDVYGMGVNMDSQHHWITVTTTARGGTTYMGPADFYRVQVPIGDPFAIIASEWTFAEPNVILGQEIHNWTVSLVDPIKDDTHLNIDFAEAVEPTVVSGFMADSDDPRLRNASAVVTVRAGVGGLVGVTTGMDRARGGFHYTVEYVDVPMRMVYETSYKLIAGGLSSVVLVQKPPQETSIDPDFLAPPEVVARPENGRSHAIEEPIRWRMPTVSLYDVAGLWIHSGPEQIGVVYAPPFKSSMMIPELPARVDAARLQDGPLTATVFVCRTTSWGDCTRYANDTRVHIAGKLRGGDAPMQKAPVAF